MPEQAARLTVFFDGQCPLCKREISFYQRCRGGDQIAWVDVADWHAHRQVAGLTKQAALARFHVRTTDGKLYNGGQAFAQLWMALPAFRPLGLLGKSRAIAWILDKAYDRFLVLRPLIQRFFR
jgi:predicted DCC family thiol-disulfide oxidoreductase YuxK